MSKPVVLVLLVLAGIGVGVRPIWAQSLADIAKQEEERRKTVSQPAKVYTNKDLTPAPPGSPPPPAAAPADAAKDAGKDKETKDKDAKDKDKPAKDQAYWSGRLKDLQTQLDRDQAFAEAIQTRINSLTTDFVNRDDPAQRGVIERDRQKALAELARLTKAVQDDKKAVADLQEEARRAGVPPGWLR
jgi:DNA repair exonuclease SbcCD ATPase subunit